MDIVSDVFSLKLFAQDSSQVERVSCVRRHLHLVYEELTCLVSYSLLLPKPCMEPVPVLVQLRHEVVFRNQFCIATFSANGVIEALQAVLRTIGIFTIVSKDKSARIWLKSLEEEDIG